MNMTSRTLEIEDVVAIDADDWAALEPKAAQFDASAELQRQVDEFLANGGKIQTCVSGQTAIPDNLYMWSQPVGRSIDSDPVLREESKGRRLKAQTASQRRGSDTFRTTPYSDAELVKIIDSQLGVAKTKKELRDSLKCSDTLLQRLLFAHFHDDPRADPYRQVNRGDLETARVKRIRELVKEGHKGLTHIARVMGLRKELVMAMNRRHGLNIPHKEAGITRNVTCTNSLCHATFTNKAKYCPQCGTITAHGIEAKRAAR